MRWLGALLVLAGAGGGFVLVRQQSLLPMRLAQALLVDLGVLSGRICWARKPLAAGLGARFLWGPLLTLLEQERGHSLPDCWARAADSMPPPLNSLLAPLGPLLPAGGPALARAIEETREELTGFLREERARQAAEGRLAAALCLSGACFLILVLM